MPFKTSLQLKQELETLREYEKQKMEELKQIQLEENKKHIEELDLREIYKNTFSDKIFTNQFNDLSRNIALERDIQSLFDNLPYIYLANEKLANLKLYAKQVLNRTDYNLFIQFFDRKHKTDIMFYNKITKTLYSIDFKILDFSKSFNPVLSIYRAYPNEKPRKLTFTNTNEKNLRNSLNYLFPQLKSIDYRIEHQVWFIHKFDLYILNEQTLKKLYSKTLEDTHLIRQHNRDQYVINVNSNDYIHYPNFIKEINK